MRLRLALVACCGIAIVTASELRSDDKTVEKRTMDFRQISVQGRNHNHGLSVFPGASPERALFGEGQGAQWDFRQRDDKWVIALRTYPQLGQKPYFLSFVTEQPKASEIDVVILKSKVDETGLWEIEFEGDFKEPTKRSDIVCTAKAASGTFRGWYLTVGETAIEKNVNGRSAKLWPISLSKEKTERSRLRIWVDGK